jgi:hypothetical protein
VGRGEKRSALWSKLCIGVKKLLDNSFRIPLTTLGRFAGKLLGSRVGAQVSHAPESIKKYLGLALLPTAGVTVGLVLEAKDLFGSASLGGVIISGVLGSVMINELLTPFFVRYALFKTGEATQS